MLFNRIYKNYKFSFWDAYLMRYFLFFLIIIYFAYKKVICNN